MDWKLAQRVTEQMLEICGKHRETESSLTTMTAAMLLLVCSFDEATKEIEPRPADLIQLYGWAARCLDGLKRAFPVPPEKLN